MMDNSTRIFLADSAGYCGAVVGTFLMLPQILKTWKTKQMEDVSHATVILYVFNCLFWLIYGLGYSAAPVIIANGIALVISIVQVRFKVKFSTRAIR